MNIPLLITLAAAVVCVWLLRLAFARARRERASRVEADRALRHAVQLAELTAALSRTRLPAEATRAAVVELVHAFGASAGAILLTAEDGRAAIVADAVGYPAGACDPGRHVPLASKSQITEAIRRFELLVTGSRSVRAVDFPEMADDILDSFEAAAVVPLVSAQRVIGAIALSFDQPRALDGDEHGLLLTAGRYTAQALVRALAYESALRSCEEGEDFRVRADAELRERHRAEDALRESEGKYRALAARTTRLYELSAALSEAITLDSVAKVIIRHGKMVVGASAGSVAMLVDEGRQFETLYAEGYTRLAIEAWHRFAVDPGLCATAAAATKSPVLVGSLTEWQRMYPGSGSLAADGGYESAAALPLLAEGAVIGVVSFHFAAPVNFSDDYAALLRSVAQHCAQALDRARLYEAAQRARADAESANRAKDDFLSTVSHELRTPLNAMLGWASLLRSGTLDQARRARAIEAIFNNASRQARLIEDLLDVSRIVAGRASLDKEELALVDCLRGAVEAVMPMAESQGLTLRLEPIPDVAVAADPRRLEQVFLNLVSNAVKFTPSGGRVTIDAARNGDTVAVRVADTGTGIDPAFLPHVFDRFRQGDATSSRRVGGLGLGLFIARHLVEAHGGAIAAASAGRDCGTTFTVTLPVAGASGTTAERVRVEAPASADPLAAASLAGVRVLLVDDEPDALEVMSSALETCGATVQTALSAREALDSLARQHFDVLLSDIAMPDTDGYELIRGIRRLDSADAAHIPAAAVTAFASDQDRERALAAGFQTHLTKPVAPAALAEAVAHLVHAAAS